MSTMATGLRIASDVGGTFTDVAVFDEASGGIRLGKTLTTPSSLIEGMNHGVGKAGADFADAACSCTARPSRSTRSSNARARKTALVTTEGFRDVYEIGRINRPDSFNLFFRKHVPLVGARSAFRSRRAHAPRRLGLRPLLDEAEARSCRAPRSKPRTSRRSRFCSCTPTPTSTTKTAMASSCAQPLPNALRHRVA